MIKNKERYKNIVIEYGDKELFSEYDCKLLAEVVDAHIGDIPQWFRDVHMLNSHEIKNSILKPENR